MSVLESLTGKIISHYDRFFEATHENPLNISERGDLSSQAKESFAGEDAQEVARLQKENEFSRVLVLFVQFNKCCFLFGNFDDFSRSMKGVHKNVLHDRRSVDAFLDCCYRMLLDALSFNFAVLQSLYFILTGSTTTSTIFTQRFNKRNDIFQAAFGQLPCPKVGQETILFGNALLDLLTACSDNKHVCFLSKMLTDDKICLLAKAVQTQRHPEIEALRHG